VVKAVADPEEVLRQYAEVAHRPSSGIPPGTPQPQLALPLGDVHLADGRTLYRMGLQRMAPTAEGPPDTLACGWWRDTASKDGRRGRGLLVIASLDCPTPHVARGTYLLHVSLSYGPDAATRLPSWKDVGLVKGAFFGDADAMMVLPRAEDYVDLHHGCLQLWATPVTWGIR
jgi:hypothetical protein